LPALCLPATRQLAERVSVWINSRYFNAPQRMRKSSGRTSKDWVVPIRNGLAAQTLPEPVVRFVQGNIESVSEVEVLLLLRAQLHAWSPTAVATELRLTPRFAELTLHELYRRRLLTYWVLPHTYIYDPKTEEQRSLVDDLASHYETMRHAIIDVIFSGTGGAGHTPARAHRPPRGK
jgi:hypothetical protein